MVALLMALLSFAEVAPAHPSLLHEQHPRATELGERLAFQVEGVVLAPDGSPAEGAVVVSTAGGSAVADRSGSFELHVRIERGLRQLRVTAIGAGSEGLVASRQVSLPLRSGRLAVGSLQLLQGSSCTQSWLPTFGSLPGVNGPVQSMVVFDDGSGSALYLGGSFTYAGGTTVNHVAKWDGMSWSGLGTGVDDDVLALEVYDDGGGAALYAAGDFTTAGGAPANRIAKWDGSSWSALGNGLDDTVRALETFDGGAGTDLYVGGDFLTADGGTANRIAKWNGSVWLTLQNGIDDSGGRVNALMTYDDGGGADLYVGGRFTSVSGFPANRVARWNGLDWSAVGAGVTGPGGTPIQVHALTVFDDGGGAALIAGGEFSSAGITSALRIAKWDGTSWSALGSGISQIGSGLKVNALEVFDDGGGAKLYVGGAFIEAGGMPANYIARWDGSVWSNLGAGVSSAVSALMVFDDGNGANLYVGGTFLLADGATHNRISKYDGSAWSPPLGSGLNGNVRTLTVFDDGSGPALFVGGIFKFTGGGVSARHVAKWDGTNWSALGSGTNNTVWTLAVFDDGDRPALYAGGAFTSAGGVSANRIAKWNGSTWSALGSGISGGGSSSRVWKLLVFDDGGGDELYAGGIFSNAGGHSASALAKWNGSSWAPVGTGFDASHVADLIAFDDGGGSSLIVGGSYVRPSGVVQNGIAQWDGSTWTGLGSGTNNDGAIRGMAVYDDGGGTALYAGGIFSIVGMPGLTDLARWDGTTWSAVGGGVDGEVTALAVHDDGRGSELYAGGRFQNAGGQPANRMAKWDGTAWAPLGSGVGSGADPDVESMVTFDDGFGDALYVAGYFESVLDSGDSFLGKWGCPIPAPLSSPDTTISLASGGQQVMDLNVGSNQAGWFFFLFGSVTGTVPGLDFGGGVLLPLNIDPYFNLTLFKPGLSAFGNFRGTLDGSGKAQASLTLPPLADPTLVGVVINHAFLSASVLGVAEFASNAVPLTLTR